VAQPAQNVERTVAVAAPPQKTAAVVALPVGVLAKKFPSRKFIIAAVALLLLLIVGRAWKNNKSQSENDAPTVEQAARNDRKSSRPAPQPRVVAPLPPVAEPVAEPAKEPAGETKEPAKEPEAVPVEEPPKTEPVTDPEPARRSGPPAWSKGRRNRRQESSAKATLAVECAHNFRDGILEITSGGSTILRASLRGNEQALGPVKIYSGVYRATVQIPAGEHVFDVRARSALLNFSASDQIGGAFARDGSRTMLIDFGKGSGIGVFTRRLTLRWK
jgi:hypothetical protein